MNKANWNEQYSRKNIKVHGKKEQAAENTIAVVQTLIKENTNATLNDEDVIAIHRIPGRKGFDRPILVRLKYKNAKSAIMKQRSEIKRKSKSTYRLSDDVTKRNSDLSTNWQRMTKYRPPGILLDMNMAQLEELKSSLTFMTTWK